MANRLATSSLTSRQLRRLDDVVRDRYSTFTSGLPFHGWHHIAFVRKQAAIYARKNGADIAIVEAAAILHDLNYMVLRNSRVGEGKGLRREILQSIGVEDEAIKWIERVITEAETEARDVHACLEAQALSDADTIFKALPITPVLLAHRYMRETGQTTRELCDRIIRDQVRLRNEGIYFYDDDVRKQYDEWAAANLRLWQCIDDSLRHEEVRDLVAFLESNPDCR